MKTSNEYLFENLLRKFRFHQNYARIPNALHEDQYTILITSRSVLLRIRNVSDKSCRENQNTHFEFNIFLPKIVPFMKKCGKILQSRAGTIQHAHSMLDTQGYKHTLTICNTYYFSTGTVDARRCLDVSSYVFGLS